MATRRAWARVSDRVVTAGPLPPPAGSDEPLAHGVHRRLHARVHLELVEDVADVVAHGVLGDEQLGGDLAVEPAAGHEPQDAELAIGEPRQLETEGGRRKGVALAD